MRRIFWTALGATAGILAARQVRRTATSLTPPALAASLGETVRGFVAEVKVGMAEREAELRDQLGLGGASGTDVTGSAGEGSGRR